jgi:hypothetical protein
VSVPARVVTLLVAFAAVVAGAVFLVINYVAASPPRVAYQAAGGQVNLMLQEDPQNDSASTPDWVSYYVQDPQTKQWVHTTLFSLPKGARVNVTILGYDGCTPLRNNLWSGVEGTIGGTVNVQQYKGTGKPLGPAVTTSTINAWAACNVAHTFAIPSLHLFVPVGSPDSSYNGVKAGLCSTSPCTSGPYTLEKFSFMAPNHDGVFRWQCLVPCGGGFIDGNGGPMQSIGYMTGDMEVTG